MRSVCLFLFVKIQECTSLPPIAHASLHHLPPSLDRDCPIRAEQQSIEVVDSVMQDMYEKHLPRKSAVQTEFCCDGGGGGLKTLAKSTIFLEQCNEKNFQESKASNFNVGGVVV